jgi:hypothetical protein
MKRVDIQRNSMAGDSSVAGLEFFEEDQLEVFYRPEDLTEME